MRKEKMSPQLIEVTLEPAELAYCLHSLGATSLMGADPAVLFPAEGAHRDALLEQGFQSLKAHGWLVADEKGGYNTDPTLALMMAVVAAPQVVLITSRYLAASTGQNRNQRPREMQIATHYMADQLTIEQIYGADNHYHFVSLPERSMAVARTVDALAPTPYAKSPGTLLIPDSFAWLGQLKDGDAVDLAQRIKTLPLSPADQQLILSILSEGTLRAEMMVTRMTQASDQPSHPMTLVDALGVTWMINDIVEGTQIQPVNRQMLKANLSQTIDEFFLTTV